MANYMRSWKRASDNNYYRPKFEPPRSKGKGLGKKILRFVGSVFSYLFGLLAWFLGKKGMVKTLVTLGVLLGLLGFISFGALFAYYSFNLPDPNKLAQRQIPESTKIYDRNNKLLYEIHGEAKRTLVPFEQIPKVAKQAIIAIEDKNFYKHKGISLTGIARAVLINIFTDARPGGSTITQQFVRNAVLTREKTFARKFKEIALSLQLERRYSKDQILQLYLNEIPYGGNSYGIQAASQTFFGKDVGQLSLAESAYLAAIPNAPTFYSPYGPNRKELDDRADTTLQLMYEQGYITKGEREKAQNQKVEFRNIGRGILAPHFVLYVQDLLAQKYGEVTVREGGFRVTTSLDLDLQTMGEEIVATQAAVAETKYNATNAGLVAIDPRSGEILAMVGSRDYFDEKHDGAVNIPLRPLQPGSSFKPYVYATAFEKGMSPATMLMDVTTNFGEFGGKSYIPANYDEKERGPVSIRQALQGSLNIPAVKALLLTGIEDSIQTAEKMGINTLKDRSRFGPAIVLGGAEVKLLEHTAAYGVFAAGGVRHESVAILKVEDRNGKVLEEFRPSQGKEVLNPQIAYQITNVLSDNDARAYIFGRNNRLALPGRPAAAKTGTTQEYRDAWTMGYVPSLVAGVWMGNNDHSPMKGGASGSLVAAAIWNEFMTRALHDKPVEQFTRPEGITEVTVDSLSGKLPTAYTHSTKTEIFSAFNTPSDSDDVHIPVEVDGQIKVYTVLHSEKPGDPAWEEPIRLWAERNGYTYPESDGTNPGTPKPDPDVSIKLNAPEKVASVPWKASAIIEGENISQVEFYLDGRILQTFSGGPYDLTSAGAHANGQHQLTVKVYGGSNRVTSASASIDFALEKDIVILQPQANQSLTLPTNVVAESSFLEEPEQVKFVVKTAGGNEYPLNGKITRTQGGKIYFYTLNWPADGSIPKGSYAISTVIENNKSSEVIIKLQ